MLYMGVIKRENEVFKMHTIQMFSCSVSALHPLKLRETDVLHQHKSSCLMSNVFMHNLKRRGLFEILLHNKQIILR